MNTLKVYCIKLNLQPITLPQTMATNIIAQQSNIMPHLFLKTLAKNSC